MDMYFTLGFIIQYYCILLLKVFQRWSLGSLSGHLDLPPSLSGCLVFMFWALPYFSALWDTPGSPCVFPAPVLEQAVSPRRLPFLANISSRYVNVVMWMGPSCFFSWLLVIVTEDSGWVRWRCTWAIHCVNPGRVAQLVGVSHTPKGSRVQFLVRVCITGRYFSLPPFLSLSNQ